MKKILLSIMSVFVVVALVSGAAWALFSDTASITGITFATGSADLLVSVDGAESFSQGPLATGLNFDFTNLSPGQVGSVDFVDWGGNTGTGEGLALQNAGTVDLSLNAVATFTCNDVSDPLNPVPCGAAALQGWRDWLEIAITPDDGVSTAVPFTLGGWETPGQVVLPVTFTAGLTQGYNFSWELVDTLDPLNPQNAIENTTIDVDFTFTGTQL